MVNYTNAIGVGRQEGLLVTGYRCIYMGVCRCVYIFFKINKVMKRRNLVAKMWLWASGLSHLIVAQVIVGSNPTSHPQIKRRYNELFKG